MRISFNTRSNSFITSRAEKRWNMLQTAFNNRSIFIQYWYKGWKVQHCNVVFFKTNASMVCVKLQWILLKTGFHFNANCTDGMRIDFNQIHWFQPMRGNYNAAQGVVYKQEDDKDDNWIKICPKQNGSTHCPPENFPHLAKSENAKKLCRIEILETDLRIIWFHYHFIV